MSVEKRAKNNMLTTSEEMCADCRHDTDRFDIVRHKKLILRHIGIMRIYLKPETRLLRVRNKLCGAECRRK